MYTLILFVFVQAIGQPVGFASTHPFATINDCIMAGDREMANPFNPATKYLCRKVGEES